MSALSFERISSGPLDGIELEVRASQLWALLGPNGAGKSTLLKVALGVLPCKRGKVLLGGVDTASLDRKSLARQVAWVPQSPAEDVGFTALELVLMGRTPHLGTFAIPSSHDVARAMRCLEQAGLEALAHRRLDEMSGGERRLCYLARARMQDAKVLLLDEPTAFLDMRHQVECLRSVADWVDGGAAALCVLHDVNLAKEWATHVALLRAGKLLAAGPKAEVLEADALSELYGVRLTATEGGLFSARA